MKKNIIFLILPFLLSCGGGKEKLIVFHAGSLSVPMQKLTEAFMELHPEVHVEREAAGSRSCARKISDLGRECDVFASADYTVIDQLLIPEYARWNISFASNELVLTYTDRSAHSGEIDAGNWHRILAGEDVVYGRSDPNSDPCGYRTVLSLRLADIYYGEDISQPLLEKDRRMIRPKETDLLALLESGALDYVFIYKSVARQHGLKVLELPSEINLGDPAQAMGYSKASVEISGKSPGSTLVKRGEPMVYGLTIPSDSPNPGMAMEFVRFMLSEQGMQIIRDCGQKSLLPFPSTTFDKIPESLKEFAVPAG